MSSKDINKKVWEFKMGLLNQELSKCTIEQQQRFKQLFPQGVNEKNFNTAADLIGRTLTKNPKMEADDKDRFDVL